MQIPFRKISIAKPKLDNARVNRADKKCKLVKPESDTMGGHDHPTIDRPQRFHGFGSTLCYPATDVFRVSILQAQANEVEHVRNAPAL